MVRTAEETWSDDWQHVPAGWAGSDGLLGAATGIAFGIALGLAGWAVIVGLVWLLV